MSYCGSRTPSGSHPPVCRQRTQSAPRALGEALGLTEGRLLGVVLGAALGATLGKLLGELLDPVGGDAEGMLEMVSRVEV